MKNPKNLDLATNVDIIQQVEASEKKSSSAEAFEIPRSPFECNSVQQS